MKGNATRVVRFVASLLGLGIVGWVLAGQAAKPVKHGLPTDWTHRHVIFSQPTTLEEARDMARDPRYQQQWIRQNVVRVLSSDSDASGAAPFNIQYRVGKLHQDWSQNLGSGASVGAGNFPAKYSFGITTASCANGAPPDFVVFSTGLAGSATQASIVAYDNLYSGCTGTVPSTFWAYNTGGQIQTSPVFAGDGLQVAFVQTSSGVASLVLLKWFASATDTVSSPTTLTAVAPSAYFGCIKPCMTTIPLTSGSGGATADTTSSVFYDYGIDVAWVGDGSGWLHQFFPVFSAAPAEIRTAPWPVHVNAGSPLSSPVHDRASGNVFVGDQRGFLYRVATATGAVTRSGRLDFAAGVGIVAGPVVDPTISRVYAFASNDGSTACAGATSPCAAVHQLATNFVTNNTGTRIRVGTSSATPNPLYDGAFDSDYLATATRTGKLYVCGNTGGAPTLYEIPITAGAMGAAVAGPVLAGTTTGCSPVTDIANANIAASPTEWIFASAQASGMGNSCAGGGCIMHFKDKPWQPSHNYTVGQEVIDTHFQIQVCRVAGTSRTAALGHPAWNTTLGGSTTDNTVRWLNQGPHLAGRPGWVANNNYALNTEILDSNKGIQLVITAGTSQPAPHPVWNTNVNGTTTDGTVTWRNVGSVATVSLATAGGTSGIIMDNTVGAGTLAGASRVYFSTQGNQTCGTSGTGGCAVQASQNALR